MSRHQWDTRQRHGRWGTFRYWIIPVIGAVTPTALIIVNIAALIVHNLNTLRLFIAIMAFVSGMMLNSWAGLSIYRWIKRRYHQHPLVHESNQDVVLISGMTVIIAASFITAWFCYTGLSQEQNLPNLPTFLLGVLSILIPIVLRVFFDSSKRGLDDLGSQ